MKKHRRKPTAYIIHILGVLTKPQRRQAVIYLLGLIWIVKFRSINRIAEEFGHKDTDGLHHFLRHSPVTSQQAQEASREHTAACIKDSDHILLAIDDTPVERRGKHIEGVAIHHSAKGLIKGLCAVTAIVMAKGQKLAWCIQSYYPKSCCPKEVFESKVTIAIGIIDQARQSFKQPVTVLMDSWYACAPILTKIIEAGWDFVCAIKVNRKVIVNGRVTHVCNLAKGPREYITVRLSAKRIMRVAKATVILPKVGVVALLICKHGQHETRFFISSLVKLSARQLVKLYRQRFEIEFFHRDIKQYLGFGEMFMRSHHGVQKHWTLVLVAYNTVTLLSPEHSQSFRRKINCFRRMISWQNFRSLTRASV
jgi:SRSO17 transposase